MSQKGSTPKQVLVFGSVVGHFFQKFGIGI